MEERKTQGIGYVTGTWPLDPQKSTIVFIHGAGGSSLFWESQIEGLSSRVNTLAIDLPGHGRSEGEGRDTIEGYAHFVVEFIERVGVPNPIPCGLSMGGAVALQLLLDHSDFLKAGILLNTGAKLKVAPAVFDILEKDFSGYLSMIAGLVASPTMNPEKLKRFEEETARCKPEVTRRDFLACNGFDVMQRTGSITLPVLVVSAENDQLTPPKYGEFLKNTIPNASLTLVTGAGHILPLEKPDEFNRVVIQFLDTTRL